MKRSIIYLINHDDLQKIIDESNSVVEILRKLGYKKQYNGNHKLLIDRLNSEAFDMRKFNLNKSIWKENHYSKLRLLNTKHKDIFCKESKYDKKSLKKKIIKEKLLEYACSECGNNGWHNNKILSLQLDHINGDSNDNRIENLRFLCPNCHSQTPTFSGKSLKKDKLCIKCKEKISGKYKKLCDKCRNLAMNEKARRQMKFHVDKSELKSKIIDLNWNFSAVGRHYGVTDNAIRKRCIKEGILKG